MVSKTLVTHLAIICLLQYSLAEANAVPDTSSQEGAVAKRMSDFLSRRSIERRDTAAVENVMSRSQQLKARMSDVIHSVESQVQERSKDFASGLQVGLGRMIDFATRMLVERMQAEEAQNAAGEGSSQGSQ